MMRNLSNLLRCVVAVGVGLAVSGGESLAHGADSTDRADELFQQGVQFMREDKCPDAVPRFLRSQQLDPSAGTLVNLGTCYARLGRPASALRSYQKASLLAVDEQNTQAAQRAAQALAIVSHQVIKLTLVASHGVAPLAVTVNGEPLHLTDGDNIPLDPGENVIEVATQGRPPWRHTVHATEIGATIVLEVPDATEPAPADWRVPAIVMSGAGAAALFVGGVLAFSAKRSNDESGAECVGNICNPAGSALREDAGRKAWVSNVAVPLGAALLGAGVVLWFAPSKAPSRATVGLSTRQGELGVLLGGSL